MMNLEDTPLEWYEGDFQPIEFYVNGDKLAGWHPQTVSGEGTISLDGAYNIPPDALVIDGKCAQDTTTGKNLLVFPYYDGNSKITGGVTFTVNPDGSVHAFGTATSDATFYINNAAGFVIPVGTYTFSGCPSGGNADNGYYMRINYSGFVLTDIGAGATATRASVTSSTVPIYIRVRAGVTVNHTFYPQLELGSTATAYEPYTGGIPSPNPDYPQPITSITGDLTIRGTGKNLLSNPILGEVTTRYGHALKSGFHTTAKGSTDYILSLVLPAGNVYYANENLFVYKEITGTGVRQVVMLETLDSATLKSKSTISKTVILKNSQLQPVPIGSIGSVQPQLELGSTATAYEPYMSDTVVTPLGSVEICSLPDGTKDTHDAVTGVVTKRVGKVVFDGSADEGWRIGSGGVVGISLAGSSAIPDMAVSNWGSGYCSAFIVGTGTKDPNVFRIGANNTICYFYFSEAAFANVDAWRAFLAANPVTVYYKLATPYTIQLTPDLPVVRTGIKTLTVSANITPSFTATVKAMDD